jgi:phosphoadenosine phosphosulfate reductase
MKIDRSIPVAYLDTGLLFEETYALVETVAARYGITPIAIVPKQSVQEQKAVHGDALWAREPQRCCALRKVDPQRAFLGDYDAWITGIRRDQSSTRKQTHVVQWDERAVWRYIADHDIPYNPLLSRGYTSIGCTHCTRPVATGEDARAGRWSGFEKTECGLHVSLDSSQL